jgi:hypothetical protein
VDAPGAGRCARAWWWRKWAARAAAAKLPAAGCLIPTSRSHSACLHCRPHRRRWHRRRQMMGRTAVRAAARCPYPRRRLSLLMMDRAAVRAAARCVVLPVTPRTLAAPFHPQRVLQTSTPTPPLLLLPRSRCCASAARRAHAGLAAPLHPRQAPQKRHPLSPPLLTLAPVPVRSWSYHCHPLPVVRSWSCCGSAHGSVRRPTGGRGPGRPVAGMVQRVHAVPVQARRIPQLRAVAKA